MMTKRVTAFAWFTLVTALVVACGVFGACRQSEPDVRTSRGKVDRAQAAQEPAPARSTGVAIDRTSEAMSGRSLPARASRATRGFSSPQHLAKHFEKHGAEFGNISKQEYLARAQRLRDAPAGADVLEIVRGDGAVSRFDRATGAFIAFQPDGTIRTFFRPNDGEAYFHRQARQREDR